MPSVMPGRFMWRWIGCQRPNARCSNWSRWIARQLPHTAARLTRSSRRATGRSMESAPRLQLYRGRRPLPTSKTSPPNANAWPSSVSPTSGSTSTRGSPVPPAPDRLGSSTRRGALTGDTLVVPKLDRLARSVPDARAIGDNLAARGINLSLGGQVYDPADPVGKMFFNILATLAEFAKSTCCASAPARAWPSRRPRANSASSPRSNKPSSGGCTAPATTASTISPSCSPWAGPRSTAPCNETRPQPQGSDQSIPGYLAAQDSFGSA